MGGIEASKGNAWPSVRKDEHGDRPGANFPHSQCPSILRRTQLFWFQNDPNCTDRESNLQPGEKNQEHFCSPLQLNSSVEP
ncbi:hypothetical protein SUGI_0816100, partial [Cryptomeria japonica]